MIYIVLSILLTTYLGVAFTLFAKFKIDAFQAIVINYCVCVVTGILFSLDSFRLNTFYTYPDFKYAVAVGSLFIVGFWTIAKTIEHFGLSVATVTQRMTLICTTIFAVTVFQEPLSIWKILGLIIAVLALIFINWSPGLFKKGAKQFLLFPIAVFVLISFGDSILLYAERVVLSQSGDPRFVITTFLTAATLGSLVLLFTVLFKGVVIRGKNVLGGILLGIPNFFSLYYMLKALGTDYDASVIFPIINIAIIALSTIIGVLFFKERFSLVNGIGVLFSIIAIVLISLS